MRRLVIFSPEEIEKLKNNEEVSDPTYNVLYMSEERYIQHLAEMKEMEEERLC